jgi:hypothetical protein
MGYVDPGDDDGELWEQAAHKMITSYVIIIN